MSKPALTTWPFVMLLLDYWPLGRMQKAECRMQNPDASGTQHARRLTPHASRLTARSQIANRKSQTLFFLLVEKIPFFALVALISVVTFLVHERTGALAQGEYHPLDARLQNAVVSYGWYLEKLFWPADLAIFYPHPGYWPMGKVLLAGGLILGLSVLVWVGRRRHPYLLVGWLWYCGTLVPMSMVIQSAMGARGDRYTYVPSLGALILIVWGAWELTRRWQYQVLGISLASGAVLILCLPLTRQQLGYWTEGETLLRHLLAATGTNEYSLAWLGDVLARKGRQDEANRLHQAAVRLVLPRAEAHINLGLALDKKGQTDKAIRQYQEALSVFAFSADAHYHLGNALDKKGQTDEAIRHYQIALNWRPDYAEAHNGLGIAFYQQHRTDEAIGQFQEALRLRPDYAAARKHLEAALATRVHSSSAPGGATNR